MSTSTVQLKLQVVGQQAAQYLKKLNKEQERAGHKQGQLQQQQKQNLTQIQQHQQRINTSVQQGGRYSQQQLRTGQSMVQTNRLLVQILQQQQRQSGLIGQQLRQQERSYQVQVNSLRAQVRETDRLRQNLQQVGRIQRENNQQSSNGSMGRFQTATAVAGGLAAGGMIVSNALQKPRDYAQMMTYITTTATGGEGLSVEQRLKKISVFEGFVKDTVRQGGGTREDAAAALNELIASGKYEESNVYPALLASAKTAFAADADTVDAAKMTLAMQNFGVQDLSLAQDRAMRAGQVGSFEYRDLAKFLPSQMAMARASGYSGDDGLIKLLAMNQISKTTAADSAEAGNNVVNLLQKLSSRELSDNLAKKIKDTRGLPIQEIKNTKGKVVGHEFDWATYSMQQREQGVYGVEAFVKLLERQLQGNERYLQLQKEAIDAKTPAQRKGILDDMSSIAMGSELGQFIADRQALLAAMAVVYNKDQVGILEQQISAASGTVDDDLSIIKQTEWAKDMAADQERLFAQSKAYDAVSDALGNVKVKITEWAQGNENLAATAYGGGVALTALGAAAGVATIALGALGGKGAFGGTGRLPSSSSNRIAGGAGAAGQVAVVGALGYGVGTEVRNLYMRTESGQKFDNWGGEKIAQVMAFFGNETAKEAVESQKQYEAMIKQQEEQNKKAELQNILGQELVNKINTLIDVTSQNKPLPMSGSNFLDVVGHAVQTESNRHGGVPPLIARR